MSEQYEIVIGLEVHAELKTETKLFCGCRTAFGAEPNTQTCPVCLGLPGVLPVMNKKAVDFALKTALALNCEIARFSKFDRKNYYYPDLPKNFQISQYDLPLAQNGYIDIDVNGETRRIRIKRVHLEEDAGKLLHQGNITTSPYSLVDYNRTGVPLLEIVSEPDIHSPEEARLYLNKLKSILEYIDVSDCKMEEGSLRCDANISLRPKGSEEFGTKTELKNLNSFKAVQRGLEYEAQRQEEVLSEGGRVIQETRHWDENRGITVALRSKEQAHDYRYFPEPDLVPVVIDNDWINELKKQLPELPDARKQRFMDEYGLPRYDAEVLTASRLVADYFDTCVRLYNNPKVVSNWIMGELLKHLNAKEISILDCPVAPESLVEMLKLIDQGTISGKIAKTVFEEMFETGKSPAEIVKEKGLVQITDEDEIAAIVDQVIAAYPQSVADYKNGKDKALGFLVGQIMRHTKGRANPELVNRLLKERL